MSFRVLSTIVTQFNVFLGIVPSSPSSIKEESHEDSSHGPKHQIGSQHFSTQERFLDSFSDKSKDQPDHNGSYHTNKSRKAHLSKSCFGHQGDTPFIIRFGLVGHDIGILTELTTNLQHNLMGCAAHRRNGQSCKVKDNHASNQTTHKDFWCGNIHGFEGKPGEFGELVHKGTEEKEARHGCRPDGVSLGHRLGDISGGIQSIGYISNVFRLHGHFGNTTGVVCNRTVVVHGEDIYSVAQHTHGCNGGSKESCVSTGANTCASTEMVRHEHSDGDCDGGDESRLHSDTNTNNNVGSVSSGTCFGDALNRPIVIIGVVLSRQYDNVGTDHAH
mmetsp:Transcript_5200/g.8988  ORF Transcript_5200/g.8988 Transcript_5200/m.8988 type:complete len:331 (+) Transcript_5200:247-1239(+)